MEIEAKYAITGDFDAEQIRALVLAPYWVRDVGARSQHDIIIDTPDQRLGAAKHNLRLRQIGDQVVVTLKRGGTTSGAIHTREELEEEVADTTIDLERWPAEIADPVRALIGDQPLMALFSIDVLRHSWLIFKEHDVVALLAIDRGTVSAGGRSAPLCELEVELKETGVEADLTLLGAMLAEELPLKPEPRSKSQRGRALLSGEDIV